MPQQQATLGWTWSRYIFTNLVMIPLSAGVGGFAGFIIWYMLVFVYVIAALLIGAEVNRGFVSSRDWFVYVGAGLGIIIQWFWLWLDEMAGRSPSPSMVEDDMKINNKKI